MVSEETGMKKLRNSQGVTGLIAGLLLIGATASTCSADMSGWIAFQRNVGGEMDIWAVRPDGTGLRHLVDMPAEQTGPDWSPDSTKIVFANQYAAQLWVYDWFTSTTTKIYDAADHGGAYAIENPAWSPDGTKILFREDTSYNSPHLTLINADGTNRQVLPLGGWVDVPSWAPSGDRFVYDNRADLLIYDFSSSSSLTSGGGEEVWAAWGPTGLIVFQDNRNIAVIDPANGIRNLLTTSGDWWQPSWSPDASRIVYNRTGPDLWIMDSSGADQHMIGVSGESADWGNPVPVPGAVLLGYVGIGTALAVLRRYRRAL
jgi:Tol biopolymer transport system component